jgi:hypothetical protein
MYCLFVLFCVLFVCKCVLYCCHRVFVCKCVLYCCHWVFVCKYVLYCCHRVFVCKCVLYCYHRVFVCKCVLYCCHRVTIQLQLTNVSYQNKLYFRALLVCRARSTGTWAGALPGWGMPVFTSTASKQTGIKRTRVLTPAVFWDLTWRRLVDWQTGKFL